MATLTFTDLVILSVLAEHPGATYRQLLAVEVHAGKPNLINKWLDDQGIGVWHQPRIYSRNAVRDALFNLRNAGLVEEGSTTLTPLGEKAVSTLPFWALWPQEVQVDKSGIRFDLAHS